MKQIIILCSLVFSPFLLAEPDWQDYSESKLQAASAQGKQVVLGFHKKGCSTCHAQDAALEATGLTKKDGVVFLKVERKNKAHDSVYEAYGFNKRQWAAMVLLKEGKELARIKPGVTSIDDFKAFAKKIN
jgi:mono/diheme cytochrome c family protein